MSNTIESSAIARAHDAMAGEYDQLDDLWYPWLFARIHEFIAAHLPPPAPSATALDFGCGTGFQSFLLGRAGYDVTGVDIASELVRVARRKADSVASAAQPLFQSSIRSGWLRRHHEGLGRRLDLLRGQGSIRRPTFACGDLLTFAPSSPVDIAVCCGSTLSFVADYRAGLRAMTAALKRDGLLFLEVEQKTNMDLLWPIGDRLLGGRLKYEQDWSEIWSNLVGHPGETVRIVYPFEMHDGATLDLPMWLFTLSDLHKAFEGEGLRVVACEGIHAVSNLLPSTILQRTDPGIALRTIFECLRLVDGAVGGWWPFTGLGCSVIFCLRKTA